MQIAPITNNALQYMESNTIDYIETWRMIERSTLMEYYLTNLSFDTLCKTILVQPGNHVMSSIGTDLYIPTTERYFKFPTAKRLYTTEELRIQKPPVVETLYDRGYSSTISFCIFINGVKIPDKMVYVYAYPGGTDLFIPITFFLPTSANTLVCTIYDYTSGTYYNYHAQKVSGSTVADCPLPSRIASLDKTYINVWIDGKYCTHNNFSFDIHDSTFSITLDTELTGSTVEIMTDTTIVGRFPNNYINSSKDLFVYVPKDSTALIETSVFLHMCALYIDGFRIPMHDMAQKTYRHILYKRPFDKIAKDAYVTELIISDRHQEEKAFANYLYDFMEFEKWSTEEQILKSIGNDDVDAAIDPPFVNYVTMCFPPNNKYIIDSEVTRLMSNEQRFSKMIEENSHYFSSLLRYYSIEESVCEVELGDIPQDAQINIFLDTNDPELYNETTRYIEIYINDKKIPNCDIVQTVHQFDTNIAKIPSSYFSTTARDILKVYKYPSQNNIPHYMKFNTGTASWMYTNLFTLLQDIPGCQGNLGVYDINDLELFIIVNKEQNGDYYYLDIPEASVFYGIVPKKAENYTLREIIDNGKSGLAIKIPEGSCIPYNTSIIIANPKFHMCKQYTLATLDSNSEYRLVLNHVENGEAIPFIIGDYQLKVYANGYPLIPDTDYFLITPQTYNRISASVIMLKKRMQDNDIIEVVFTGTTNICVAGYPIVRSTNLYGFIYFDSLKMPFSLDYMDLYINNKKLSKDDVIVYTDRLVQIKNALLPFKNIVLYTRLQYGYKSFKPYIDQYEASPNLFDSYIRTFCGSIIFDEGAVIENANGNLIEMLGGENETLPLVDIPHLSVDPDADETVIKSVPFLDRIARDYNADRNKLSKYFDANVYKPMRWDEYRILLDNQQKTSHEMIFDANIYEYMKEDFDFDPNKHVKTNQELLQLLYNFFKHTIVSDMDSNLSLLFYADPLLNRYIYPDDIVPFDSNTQLTTLPNLIEDLVLDSNEIIVHNE